MKYQKVTCPNCNERLQVEAGNEGKSFACPKCHSTVTIPSVAEQAAVERPTPPPKKQLPRTRATYASLIHPVLVLVLAGVAAIFSPLLSAAVVFIDIVGLLALIAARLETIEEIVRGQ